jgi:hypothetical protein
MALEARWLEMESPHSIEEVSLVLATAIVVPMPPARLSPGQFISPILESAHV